MTVIFVGPLPPPVAGFPNVNLAVLTLLQRRATVSVFDMSPRSRFAPLLCLPRFVRSVFSRDTTALYLCFSGGVRQYFDAVYLLLGRLMGKKIFIHHHSYAYVNQFVKRTGLAFTAAGTEATHICLCANQAELLARKYSIPYGNTRVCSNLAFIGPTKAISATADAEDLESSVAIGYISNITAEKGIFVFFEFAKALAANVKNCQIAVAGPVDESIKDQFHSVMSSLPNARYAGPVYGENKDRFFASLDFLVFPTNYVNEAEPLVVWEAASAGVSSITTTRGCLPSIVEGPMGQAISAANFITEGVSYVAAQLQTASKSQRKKATQDYFKSQLVSAVKTSDGIVNEIAGKH